MPLRYHYLRERVEAGDIVLKKILGTRNCADLLTKPIGGQAFRDHAKQVLGEP